MAKISFTPDQENAIKARGTVLVAAAAGSGKTAVLAERVVRRVCDPNDPITIDRLLIVTFTNASALEMRVRIGKELDKRAALDNKNQYILKQKMLLKSAKICTIDSFCIDLVKKHFGVLGVSPDFSVASGAQAAALRERTIKDVLARHFAAPTEGFNTLCETFGIYKGENRLKEAILSVYDFSLCLSRPEYWLDSSVKNYFPENIDSCVFLAPVYDTVSNKLQKCRETAEFILRETVGSEFEGDCLLIFGETLDKIVEMKSALDNKNWDALYNLAVSFEKPNVPKIKKGQNAEIHGIIKKSRDSIFSTVGAIADVMCGDLQQLKTALNICGKQVEVLVQLVKEFSAAYFDMLNENNMLTFALIEQLALKLLCVDTPEGLVPSEISKDICKQYDEVLVDEYQDNNDLQDSLFFAVSDSGKHLFMVGDVKQCIYAFRNANPDNFLRHKDTYPLYTENSSESKVILSKNFRSRQGVCDFVNGFCGSLMQKGTCGMDYTEEEYLYKGASFPDNNAPAAELLISDTSECSVSRDVADARAVAEHILSVMNEDAFLRDGDVLRKAKFKDFAILMRSPKSKVKFYIDELKAKGIPVLYDSGDFFVSPEVLTAVSILRVIDNPTLDIPMLSALTSVSFGFSFDDVASIKAKYKGVSLYARVIAAAENGDEKCRAFLELIGKLRDLAVTLPVSRLIGEVYSLTHLKEIMSSAVDGAQKKNNLSTLQVMASDFDSYSDSGLSGFLRYYDRAEEDGSAGEKAAPSDVDAVRIMSFHGSKGLQFPVCIIAGCGNGFNLTDLNDSLIVNAKYGIGMSFIHQRTKFDTVARKALKVSQLNKTIAEEIRLFYVAMTRAEERLVLSLTTKKYDQDVTSAAVSLGMSSIDTGLVPADTVLSAKGLTPLILSAALLQKSGDSVANSVGIEPIGFNGIGNFKLILNKVSDSPNTASVVTENENKGSVDPEILKIIKERFGFKYPFEEEGSIPSKIAVTKLIHGGDKEFSFHLRPRFMSKAGLTPAERGTALHKFMQFADYSLAEADPAAEVERLREFEFISEEEAASIEIKSLHGFFESELFKRMKCADSVTREYKFMVRYPYMGRETIVQGIADCVFEENGELVIVDFKTDDVKDVAVLLERYRQQLEIYKEALTTIFGKNVKECVLYSLKLSQQIVF